MSKFGDTEKESRSEFTANLQLAGIEPGQPAAPEQAARKIEGFLQKVGVSPAEAKRSAEFITEISTIAKPEDMPGIVQKELKGLIKNPAMVEQIPKISESLSRVALGTEGLSMKAETPAQTVTAKQKPVGNKM
ncbi:MAG: hypothetical protein GC185_06080 [Alphaproteobacteria bacterium]|nr:hypothetical protein [Alphaproteobacteria bacterium]